MLKEVNKDYRLDFIRAVAIVLVVLVHSSGLVNQLSDSKSVFWVKGLYDIKDTGVPLFVMLSGALLLGKEEPLKLFFKKRMQRIFVPFIVWSLIVSVIHYLQGGGQSFVIWGINFVKDFLGRGVHGIYWFVYMIVGLYLVTPILRYVSKNSKLLIYSIFLCFCLYYCSLLFPESLFVKGFSCSNLIHVGYYLIGFALYKFNYENKRKVRFVFLFVYLLVVVCSMFQMKSYLIPLLSRYSYGIYLSHFILISFFLKIPIFMQIPVLIEPIVMVVAVLSFNVLFFYFIEKIKLSKLFM